MNDNIFIPLYLNGDMVNNLHLIVIKILSKTDKINTKNQMILKVDSPLSELTVDACKRYMQGNISLQYLDEFSRELTRKEISIDVGLLFDIKKILKKHSLLKKIKNAQDIGNIKENDFIEFTCEIKRNPLIEYIEKLINIMEMQLAFSPYNLKKEGDGEGEKGEYEVKKEVLELLKKDMEECKKEKCLKYITEELYGTKTKIVVPMQLKYLADNVDYLNDSKVTIMGKVVRVENDNNNKKIDLLSGTAFDYLDGEYFKKFKSRFLNDTNIITDYEKNLIETEYPLIQIVPIAMYV